MKITIIVLLFLVAFISSSKIRKSQRKANRADSDDELGQLAYIAHSLSYLSHEDSVAFKEDTIVDLLSNYKNVEKNGFRAIYGRFFTNTKIGLVVFRGTESFGNAMTDVNQKLVPITEKEGKKGKGCLVHEGFLSAYKANLREDLRKFTALLEDWVTASGITKVVITGHSLGGALAEMYAYDLGVYLKQTKKFKVDLMLMTFGAPRVGDACFVKVLNDEIDLKVNVRVVFGKDSVTSVPYKPEYVHPGTEYTVAADSSFTKKAFNKDESARSTNIAGAIYKLIKDVGDHLKYKTILKAKVLEILKDNQAAIAAKGKKK